MAASSSSLNEELENLRATCKEIGISAENEAMLDEVAGISPSFAIAFANSFLVNAKKEKQLDKQALLVDGCLGKTYGKNKDNFKLPPIQINRAVKPSVGPRVRKVRIKRNDQQIEVKLKTPTLTAKNFIDGSHMWVDVNDVIIPVENSEGRMHKSVLGSLYQGGKFRYLNEFGVQRLCQDMISDALMALGLDRETDTHLEFSIYMMKPDIVIVIRYRGRVIFAVEVKSPELEEENSVKVFENGKAVGQLWSYLYAMKQSGNPCPVGAIMTYNKIRIVALEDYTNGKQDEGYKNIIDQARDCLSSGTSPKRKPAEKVVDCHDRKKSPVKETKHFHESNRVLADFADELKGHTVGRDVYCSRVHVEGEVFPCLLQAIEIAFRSVQAAESEKAVCLNKDDPIGGRLLFELGETSFDWVQVRNCVKAKINRKIPDRSTKKLFIMGKLGEGTKCNVYLVCSSGGQVCAIKDYHFAQSTQATEDARESDEEESFIKLIEDAENEASRWKALYETRFEARAQCFGEILKVITI